MKKAIVLLLVSVLLVSCLSLSASAASTESVTLLPDGSVIVISTVTVKRGSSGTIGGTKTYSYKTGGTTRWMVTLDADFSFDGTSATCNWTDAYVNIYDSNFYEISCSASATGNRAYASFTVGEKFLGITIDQHSGGFSLSCDANGNLS